MEFIKSWTLGLVVASIVGTVILILTPNSTIEKQVKTAVSLFLLVSFIQPFFGGINLSGAFDAEDIETDYKESIDLNKTVSEQMELNLKDRIEEIIDSIGIKANEINIDIIINENSEMQIQNVTVIVDESYLGYENQIEEQVEERLGIFAEVEVDDGEKAD